MHHPNNRISSLGADSPLPFGGQRHHSLIGCQAAGWLHQVHVRVRAAALLSFFVCLYGFPLPQVLASCTRFQCATLWLPLLRPVIAVAAAWTWAL